MASPFLPPTTTGTSPAYIANMTALASHAFASDGFPVIVLRERYNLRTVTPADLAHHYSERIRAKIRAGGVINEAANWAGAAVWELPKAKSSINSAVGDADVTDRAEPEGDSAKPAVVGSSPTLDEFIAHSDRAKLKALGSKAVSAGAYYYLSLMARDPARTDKGAVRAVLEPFVARAQAEGCPIWLEAGNERARDVYAYFGFRVVDLFVSGKEQYDGDGMPVEDGKGGGVPTWLMMLDTNTTKGK